MRSVRIQCDVGDDAEIGISRFDGLHRTLYKTVRIEALVAIERLVRIINNRKQSNSWNTEIDRFTQFREQAIDALTLHAWHGRHGLRAAFTVKHEDRVDQIRRRKVCFGHEPTE